MSIIQKIEKKHFLHHRLDSLELSGNPIAEPETKVISNKLEAVSSLLEITARNIVKNKIKVSPDDIFPRLMAYLGKGDLNEETNIFFIFYQIISSGL